MQRAVFLDRDGTVINAIERPELDKKLTAPFALSEVAFVPLLEDAIRIFRKLGYLVIMITNQPDVAYELLSESEWGKINETVINKVRPDDCFMCRHRREDHCPMKKPSPMMIIAAADKWNVNLVESFMIGDTENDVLAGKKAGCRTILIHKNYNINVVGADFVVSSLYKAALLVAAAK
mgnify:CR=1 FL=1